MSQTTFTERLIRRDRVIVGAGLAVLVGLAWAHLLNGAGMGMGIWETTRLALSPGLAGIAPMDTMPMAMDGAMDPARQGLWTPATWLIVALMWWVMMIAMMVPSAAPMILLYAGATRHGQRRGKMAQGAVPTASFAAGYLLAWACFALAAAALQWGGERALVTSGMMMWSVDVWLSAAVLAAAGIYQLSPLKRVCLEHCRAPAEYLARHWRPGGRGALVMGLEHGTYCVGCCWALMALLFVGGVMNLVWIAGIALFVLFEKLVPAGGRIARAGGVVLIGAGAWLALGGLASV
jgi:predicted metal-binding membrane protein